MIIRTITCHDVYNLGASLQAFALQHHLEREGHDVKIIDYKPHYLSGHFSFSSVCNPKFDRPIIKQLYLLAKIPSRLIALPRKRVFDQFTSNYLKLTKRYNSYDELRNDSPSADIYIAGSDQIWNTLFPNGKDRAFYLDFGNSETKRISYAASFATKDVAVEYRKFVTNELKLFDAISIREKTSLPLLHSLGRTDGVAVCDPVFLLTRDEWNELVNTSQYKKPTQKYILLYLSDNSYAIQNTAISLRKKAGYKIISVGPVQAEYADVKMVNASPFDFIGLIRDAEFVVSNSFHATAFSLIMGTKFCVVNRTAGINERMKSVLKDFDMDFRLVSGFNDELSNEIDVASVDSRIQQIRVFSINWLNSNLTL